MRKRGNCTRQIKISHIGRYLYDDCSEGIESKDIIGKNVVTNTDIFCLILPKSFLWQDVHSRGFLV